MLLSNADSSVRGGNGRHYFSFGLMSVTAKAASVKGCERWTINDFVDLDGKLSRMLLSQFTSLRLPGLDH